MKLKNLKTKFLGRNLVYYNEIDSTQDEILRLIQNEKIENGTIVIADIQTRGKGTHGKIWYTDQNDNIAFSSYIKTNCNIKQLENITIEIAKIIVDIFEKKYKIKLSIKKPNDIVYNNKKIGGILTDSKIIGEKVKYLIIGIGINTNKTIFNDEIKLLATSIKNEFNIDIDNLEIITEFCNEFEKYIINIV